MDVAGHLKTFWYIASWLLPLNNYRFIAPFVRNACTFLIFYFVNLKKSIHNFVRSHTSHLARWQKCVSKRQIFPEDPRRTQFKNISVILWFVQKSKECGFYDAWIKRKTFNDNLPDRLSKCLHLKHLPILNILFLITNTSSFEYVHIYKHCPDNQ